ncbi:unnamed protein product [Ranitomeya imitator]|uniref:Uncharacterized protein n=1 Tax=Ranitomeya imitator TaxID=111125 RepID=A0ABN9LB44_9NEOB|nr:unnamed protein product [Ranitomeya imitator]
MKYYNHLDNLDWLEEYKTRHRAGIEAHRIVAAFSKALIVEHRMPCEGSNDLDTSGYPVHFIEDELLSVLKAESGKCLTQKYCAKKILYFMRQEATICKLKSFLQRPVEQQDIMEGGRLSQSSYLRRDLPLMIPVRRLGSAGGPAILGGIACGAVR